MWRCIRHPDLLGIVLVNSSVVRPSPCAFRSSSLPCVFMYGKSETRAHILYHIVLASTQDDVGYKHLRNWLSIEHHRFCDFPRTYLWPTRTCQNAKRSRRYVRMRCASGKIGVLDAGSHTENHLIWEHGQPCSGDDFVIEAVKDLRGSSGPDEFR
jgi:hypothetical protein